MSHIVDLTLTGEELLFNLVNLVNGTTMTADYSRPAGSPEAVSDGEYNTQIEISTTDPEYISGFSRSAAYVVQYNRIDVAALWSVVEPQIRIGNVDVVDGEVVINDKINTEIRNRYGVVVGTEDFDIVKDAAGRIIMTAKAGSLGYIGSVEITTIREAVEAHPVSMQNGWRMVEDNEKLVIVPNDCYAVGSYFRTADENVNPADIYGGLWEAKPVIQVIGDALHFYLQPAGFGMTLSDAYTFPESEFYSYIKRKANDPYNAGKADTVSANGTTVLRVTDPESSLLGRDIPIADDATGFTTYMLVSKKEGVLSTSTTPLFVWKRVG